MNTNWGPGFEPHMGFWGPETWIIAGLLAAPFILLAIVWAAGWKGLALWHSARRGRYWWFVILLVVNTFGILEIIYLFFVLKLKWKDLFSLNAHEHHAHHEHHTHG